MLITHTERKEALVGLPNDDQVYVVATRRFAARSQAEHERASRTVFVEDRLQPDPQVIQGDIQHSAGHIGA